MVSKTIIRAAMVYYVF